MSEADIHKIAQRQVAKAFAGGRNYHEMKELLHALHRAYEAGRDLAESIRRGRKREMKSAHYQKGEH